MKKLMVIAMVGVLSLTSGCALFDAGGIFAGKRTSQVKMVILGNSIEFATTCDGRYNTTATDTNTAVVSNTATSGK
jgi:hypothetical protein